VGEGGIMKVELFLGLQVVAGRHAVVRAAGSYKKRSVITNEDCGEASLGN